MCSREQRAGVAFTAATLLPNLIAFVFLLVAGACGLLQGEYDTADWYLYTMYLLPQISFFAIVCWNARTEKRSFVSIVQEQKCPWKYFLIALFLQFGLFGLSELNGVFIEWLGNFGYEDTGIQIPNVEGFGFVGVLCVIALLPAIFEESMFRGIVLKGVKSFGTVGAVLLCGGLFSLYHQNPEQTLYQFCCGAMYALLALRAGSVLPTMLAHFVNNAVVLALYKWSIALSETWIVVLLVLSVLSLLASAAYLIFIDVSHDKEKIDERALKNCRKDFLIGAAIGIAFCALNWILSLAQGM